RRTYISGDHVTRRFGVGASHSGEWYLRGDSRQFAWAELITSNGWRVRFDRITPGASYSNALFRHHVSPTGFNGAELGWIGWEWALRRPDGAIALFSACWPGSRQSCSLIETRDPDGHSIQYVRDEDGRLLKIASGDRAITLRYDDAQRIVSASGT